MGCLDGFHLSRCWDFLDVYIVAQYHGSQLCPLAWPRSSHPDYNYSREKPRSRSPAPPTTRRHHQLIGVYFLARRPPAQHPSGLRLLYIVNEKLVFSPQSTNRFSCWPLVVMPSRRNTYALLILHIVCMCSLALERPKHSS